MYMHVFLCNVPQGPIQSGIEQHVVAEQNVGTCNNIPKDVHVREVPMV